MPQDKPKESLIPVKLDEQSGIAEERLTVKNPRIRVPSFSRAPVASEVFTKEAKKAFDAHPANSRKFIAEFLATGNLELAAKASGVKPVEIAESKSLAPSDLLNTHSMTTEDVMVHLRQCLEAKTYIRDKHGNIHEGVDLKVKLSTIEMILKLHGVFSQIGKGPQSSSGVDLFEDVDVNKD